MSIWKIRRTPANDQQGMILVAIVSVLIFIGIIMMGVFSLTTANLTRSHSRILSLEAQYAAESGGDAAIAMLNSGNDSYTGTASEVTILTADTYKATYTVSVVNGSNSKERILTAVGRVYMPKNAATSSYQRTIRVVAQRSSTTAASSVLSRNIIALDSGVKNVFAKDIYANGYITTAKNTTNIVAENIYVAGKNTGSTNCSIGGTGNLVKPTSFTTPGQTKTNITMAYNNCISPPGNTSNANFNVSANQGNIATIQSTYIPWSQYMDNSYHDAGNCSDWTTGTSPRTIPSNSNAKKTHYPDSGNNISTSCGSSGDLSLGSNQFNITDNVHIRASLCAANACNPTFYNPDSATLRYVFIEGAVNFDSLQTASGSGPIAFIIYGSDPSSKASVCPYGGAGYISNGSTTAAPAIYLLTMNGICLDKTKFGAAPALGGVGGKNIYIATNPGTPFDLKLDPNFPVSQIPVDLSWRAVRYQRL